jgi:hypothetical protein
MQNKKHLVLEKIYDYCKQNKCFEFNNDIVKDISKEVGFGNPFDITKLDNKDKLPKSFIKNDIAIIHLGNGRHKFIQGINNVYHDFEKTENHIDWKYKKSLLNQYDTSESNILSVANNQRILHDFLFGKDTELNDIDILKRPKTYFPHRTKTSFEYYIKGEKVKLENIQLEVDLTIEMQGTIGVFEGKNGKPDSFSIYQIYHPFLYYYNANTNKDSSIKGKIKNIFGVFLVREKGNDGDIIKLWKYTFDEPTEMTSIKLIKSSEYKLIKKN